MENLGCQSAASDVDTTPKISWQQYDFLMSRTGQLMLGDMKRELMNIIEGCGMPERQETAVKRIVTDALQGAFHDWKFIAELILDKAGRDGSNTIS